MLQYLHTWEDYRTSKQLHLYISIECSHEIWICSISKAPKFHHRVEIQETVNNCWKLSQFTEVSLSFTIFQHKHPSLTKTTRSEAFFQQGVMYASAMHVTTASNESKTSPNSFTIWMLIIIIFWSQMTRQNFDRATISGSVSIQSGIIHLQFLITAELYPYHTGTLQVTPLTRIQVTTPTSGTVC